MNCNSIKELDLSKRDTSKVTDMSNMFLQSTNLSRLNLSNWDTRKVNDMTVMFQGINTDELDLSSFETSNLLNAAAMFINNKKLKKIYV
jgi:surface protein